MFGERGKKRDRTDSLTPVRPKNHSESAQGEQLKTHPASGTAQPGLITRPGSKIADLLGNDASRTRVAQRVSVNQYDRSP